jgi:protein-disulfide isomerase-like protein with CxxC motif
MNALAGEKRSLAIRKMDGDWKAFREHWIKISDERTAHSDALREARLAAEAKLFDERYASLVAVVAGQREDNAKFKANTEAILAEFRREGRNTRVLVVTTAIASVLGFAAFNATVLSNMVASFESGKSTASAIAALTARMDRQEVKLDELIASLKAQGRTRDAEDKGSPRR